MNSEIIVVFVVILVLLILVIFVIFSAFNKRKLTFILEKLQVQRNTERVIEEARIETQEHMLKNLSWELHDNIGQMLSVSKLQLSILPKQSNESEQKLLTDTIHIIGDVLEDIRALSRSINSESILSMGLAKSTEFELVRLNRLKFIDAVFEIEGDFHEIDKNHEIILFRIIQELISNVIKHSQATKFEILFCFTASGLDITCTDNGRGIDMDEVHYGLGLKNILSRSKLINAQTMFQNMNGGFCTKVRYLYSVESLTPIQSEIKTNMTLL